MPNCLRLWHAQKAQFKTTGNALPPTTRLPDDYEKWHSATTARQKALT
jgi:hypothetical protein